MTYLRFHNIEAAQRLADGSGVKVAVLDWLFDLKPPAGNKYVDPVSLVPGQDIGILEAWHGEWMAEIVHRIAPAAKIMPIRARPASAEGQPEDRNYPVYQDYLVRGIRLAAERGAAAVANSMGPVRQTAALEQAVRYAAGRGCVFVNVHPEFTAWENNRYVLCDSSRLDPLILHAGIVAVPAHPAEPDVRRDIFTWPYQIQPVFRDGWGYSNGPPVIAGIIALMRSANPDLTVPQVKEILIRTARADNGFRVADAEAAVKAALELRN